MTVSPLGWAILGVCLTGPACSQKTPHSDQPWVAMTVAVTVRGQPLQVGEVAFLAKKGSTGVDAGGALDAQGSATFPLLPGSYVAVVRPLPPSEDSPSNAKGEMSIPKRYHTPATSPITVNVGKGEKTSLLFDLEPS